MAKPRTNAPLESRAHELRKTADCLRALAVEVEAEQKRRESPPPRRLLGRSRDRMMRLYDAAGGLLMGALELGGPEDEGLRRILPSWRGRPTARRECFVHVCKAWRPLVMGRVVPSTSDARACAEAMRIIATGVSRSGGQ
jgi:hypothetical protein